jgi:voltage-gated potassium channel
MVRKTNKAAPIRVDATESSSSISRWDLFMLVLAMASFALVAIVELKDLDWPDSEFKNWALVDLGFVGIFFIEFVIGFARSKNRVQFLKANWFDLPGLLPLYIESLSWLRAMRLLRIMRVLRLLRLIPAVHRLTRAVSFVRRVFRESHLGYTLGMGALLIGAMATGFWILEHGTNQGISGFDDALWWAVSTATTVGYGDIAPQTGPGRILASLLMLFGIGLVGIIASTLSATLVRIGMKEQERTIDAVLALLSEHEHLVVARERGSLSQSEFEERRENLVQIARIKTE